MPGWTLGKVGWGIGVMCYESIGAAFDDIAWDGDDIWQLDRSGSTGGTPTAPTFTRYDLDYNVVDSGNAAVTESQYSAASSFTADGAGSLWWAEFASTSAVSPSPALAHGIAVYRHDIASNVSTQVLTLNAPGATTSANRKNHSVSGLEWREADNRVYIAWNYTRAGATMWSLDSFAPDGSGLTNLLFGTDTLPEYVGPLVFDADEVGLWFRARNASVLPVQYQIGHLDLSGFALTTDDPTDGESVFSLPGIPTADGLMFSPVSPAGPWRLVRYDAPGFTVGDAECDDTTNIGAVAYEQGTWGRTAFTGGGLLWVHV